VNGKQFIIATMFAAILLTIAFIPTSSRQTGSYDPWLDINDDGTIDIRDLATIARAYGTSGTPLNKTALLLELQAKVKELEEKLDTLNTGAYEKWFVDDGFGQEGLNEPRGIFHDNKTFIVYQRYDLKIYAIMYDHQTKTWANPVYVADNALVNDEQGAPFMQADNNGYLHVFFGHHTSSSIHHKKSIYPWDINAWGLDSPITGLGSATYGFIFKTNDNSFYLISRMPDAGKISYVRSTDNMATWSSAVTFVDMGLPGFAAYPSGIAYDSANNRVFVVWYLYDYVDGKNENIYGIWLNFDNGHVYAADGTDYNTFIDKAEADAGQAMILDSGINWAYWGRVHIEPSTGSIYVMYTLGSRYASWMNVTGFRAQFKRWTGTSWSTSVNIPGDTASESEDFTIAGSTLKAYVLTTEPSQLKNRFLNWLVEYTSTNYGSSWTLTKIIIYGGETSEGAIYGVDIIQDYNSELKFIFTEHISFMKVTNNYGAKLHMYAWGDDGFVYRNIFSD